MVFRLWLDRPAMKRSHRSFTTRIQAPDFLRVSSSDLGQAAALAEAGTARSKRSKERSLRSLDLAHRSSLGNLTWHLVLGPGASLRAIVITPGASPSLSTGSRSPSPAVQSRKTAERFSAVAALASSIAPLEPFSQTCGHTKVSPQLSNQSAKSHFGRERSSKLLSRT